MVRRWRNQGHARHRITQLGDQAIDLAAWQLPALTWLGALGDLDLQHFGVDQVFRSHAETTSGDLFDFRALDGAVARRVFAAFAGVGTRTQAVHGFGQGFVSLGRQGAQGNTGRVEALEDRLQRLDLADGQRRIQGLDLEQVADHRYRAVIHQARVFLELGVVALLHSGLQGVDHVRVVRMVFATVHELEQATLLDRLARAPGFGRQGFLFGFDVDETRALDAARHATKAHLADFFRQADGFEQLRTTVGGDGGDAHLRQNLQQALGDAFTVVLEHLVEVAQHFTGTDQVTQHFVREERIHRRRAETDQHRKVMRVTGGSGFDEDVGVAAQALFGQAMVHRTGGQRRMDRQLAGRNMAVAQHDLGTTGAYRFFGLVGDVTHSGFKAKALVVVQVDDLRGRSLGDPGSSTNAIWPETPPAS